MRVCAGHATEAGSVADSDACDDGANEALHDKECISFRIPSGVIPDFRKGPRERPASRQRASRLREESPLNILVRNKLFLFRRFNSARHFGEKIKPVHHIVDGCIEPRISYMIR